MQTFIAQVAEELLATDGPLDSQCVVFPSRRASVFFQDYLQKHLQKAAFAPAVYAIDDFVRELHSRVVLDQVSLTFELYPIYKKAFPGESFDKFYAWGNLLVSDFDELDRYLVPASQLYVNLHDLKAIDAEVASWANEERDSPLQDNYLRFWEQMGEFYQEFRSRLESRGMAGPGMALRQLAEQMAEQPQEIPWKQVTFAGFNALAPAEELLIRSMVDHGQARCFWDLDHYYVDDSHQEAGAFFRALRERWPAQDWNWIGDRLRTAEKDIRLTGIPKRVGQAKMAGLEISRLLASGMAPEQIAVVLPDEELLIPLLHSLPAELKDVNVTMGYPLRNTPLFSLVESLLELHENAQRLNPEEGETPPYYYKDVQNILRHPFVQQICFDECRELLGTMDRENLVFLNPEYFASEYPETHLLNLLFSVWEDVPAALDFFMETFQQLKIGMEGESSQELRTPTIEGEHLFQFYTLTLRLRDKLEIQHLRLSLQVFRRLYREVIYSGRIPFTGEPLKGLQVMGMLETRTLDFEHLIILSVNEGTLPAKSNPDTYIPYSLRKAFGLPVQEDRDAVYAYHFYRLIQRAPSVHLLYNTDTADFGIMEPSRFIYQIRSELAEANPAIRLVEETATYATGQSVPQPIEIEKAEDLQARLNAYAEKNGFSPSALFTYRLCPLKFYFQQILRIREKTGPENAMEANTFGKVLHAAMEELYLPFRDRTIQQEDWPGIRARVSETVTKEFQKVSETGKPEFGKNHLLLGVIEDLVEQCLDMDEAGGQLEIRGLEEEIECSIPTLLRPEGVKLHGVLDRIDFDGQDVRVLDYKTGKVPEDVLVKKMEELREPVLSKHKGAREKFQLATYALLFLLQHPEVNEVRCGVIPLRAMSKGILTLQMGVADSDILDLRSLEEFEGHLVSLLDEILDPMIPFTQTEDPDNCKFCPYQDMCVRG